MRPLLIVVGIAGLLLGLISSSKAQQSERVYPIVELTDADVALIDLKDGSVEDWEELVGEPTLTALDFPRTYPEDISYDPANLDFRIWLGWNGSTSRLYVALERADDLYLNLFDRGAKSWTSYISLHDSCIDLTIDGDHSGDQYIGFGGIPQGDNEKAQSWSALAEVYDTGPSIEMANSPLVEEDWFLKPPYADAGGRAYGENPTVSVTEAYVTAYDQFVWDDKGACLRSELEVGKVIGLDVTVIDRDDAEKWDALSYFFLGEGGQRTDNHPDFLLLGPGGELPDDSAVETDTWGRIKAQFVE